MSFTTHLCVVYPLCTYGVLTFFSRYFIGLKPLLQPNILYWKLSLLQTHLGNVKRDCMWLVRKLKMCSIITGLIIRIYFDGNDLWHLRLSTTRRGVGVYSERVISNVKLREFTFSSNYNFCPGVLHRFKRVFLGWIKMTFNLYEEL